MIAFCSKEAALGGFLDRFRVGASNQKDQAMIQSLELATSPHSPSAGEERGTGD